MFRVRIAERETAVSVGTKYFRLAVHTSASFFRNRSALVLVQGFASIVAFGSLEFKNYLSLNG